MEDVPDRMSVLVIGFTLKTSDRGNSRLFMRYTSGAPKTIEMEMQLHLYTKSIIPLGQTASTYQIIQFFFTAS